MLRSPHARNLAGLVGALAVVAGLLGAPASPARAATPKSSDAAAAAIYCSAGDVCLYETTQRRGLILAVPGNLGRRTSLVGYAGQDKASSWQNRSTFRWCAYDQRTRLSDTYLFTLDPGMYSDWVGSWANDRADYIEPC